MSILNIDDELDFDASIISLEYRDHEAYAGTRYGNTDEIRIEIKNQDIYTLPCESLLFVEGTILKSDGNPTVSTKLIKNFLAHMINEIRYKINDVEIDHTRNVGIASTLKGLVSLTPDKLRSLSNSGWSHIKTTAISNDDGTFNVVIPLHTLLGFFEDHTKILMNCKQELVILRSHNDDNAVLTTVVANAIEKSKIEITKLKWKMQHVEVDDETKLKLLERLRSDKPLFLGFRSWFLSEKPMSTTTTRDEWQLQAMTSLERPRYILLAFQTDKRNKPQADINTFNHCNIRNLKVYINGKGFPYVDLNVDIEKKQCAMLYTAYTSFQKSYYGGDSKPILSYSDFLDIGPIFVFDCSKQNESIKSGSVDVRIEIESTKVFANSTTAYCVVIHDRIVEYTPLTSVVRRHV
jgi:hypothetical protein